MSTPAVCDASALVAILLDSGPRGQWAAAVISDAHLVGPELVLFEAANVIRRHELHGGVSRDQAALAHADLLDLPIQTWPYGLVAERVWELRANLSAYDASYVAVAELTEAPLVTLDGRLARAPGLRCQVMIP